MERVSPRYSTVSILRRLLLHHNFRYLAKSSTCPFHKITSVTLRNRARQMRGQQPPKDGIGAPRASEARRAALLAAASMPLVSETRWRRADFWVVLHFASGRTDTTVFHMGGAMPLPVRVGTPGRALRSLVGCLGFRPLCPRKKSEYVALRYNRGYSSYQHFHIYKLYSVSSPGRHGGWRRCCGTPPSARRPPPAAQRSLTQARLPVRAVVSRPGAPVHTSAHRPPTVRRATACPIVAKT